MMNNKLQLLLVLLLAIPSSVIAAGGSGWDFVVHLNSGTTVDYAISEKPRLTFDGKQYGLVTTQATVTYQKKDVKKFTLEEHSSVDIEKTVSEQLAASPKVNRQSGMLTITGCSPKTMVRVFHTDGRLMQSVQTDADGAAVLQTGSLNKGIYILSIGKVSIKMELIL